MGKLMRFVHVSTFCLIADISFFCLLCTICGGLLLPILKVPCAHLKLNTNPPTQIHQDDIEEEIGDETRLADDLLGGAEAKGSSGAGGGAEPQSKLVKDIMSRQVEQEAPRVNKMEVKSHSQFNRLSRLYACIDV